MRSGFAVLVSLGAGLLPATSGADEGLGGASYLTGAWKLGAKDGGARHLADILGYRPNYIILRWTNRPNNRPRSPSTGRGELEDLNKDELKFQAS